MMTTAAVVQWIVLAVTETEFAGSNPAYSSHALMV